MQSPRQPVPDRHAEQAGVRTSLLGALPQTPSGRASLPEPRRLRILPDLKNIQCPAAAWMHQIRSRAASKAGRLCAKRTGKSGRTAGKMSKLIFRCPSAFLLPGNVLFILKATGAYRYFSKEFSVRRDGSRAKWPRFRGLGAEEAPSVSRTYKNSRHKAGRQSLNQVQFFRVITTCRLGSSPSEWVVTEG